MASHFVYRMEYFIDYKVKYSIFHQIDHGLYRWNALIVLKNWILFDSFTPTIRRLWKLIHWFIVLELKSFWFFLTNNMKAIEVNSLVYSPEELKSFWFFLTNNTKAIEVNSLVAKRKHNLLSLTIKLWLRVSISPSNWNFDLTLLNRQWNNRWIWLWNSLSIL